MSWIQGLTTDLIRACREFCELQINQLSKVTSNTFDKMNTCDSPLLMEEILHQRGRYIISIVYPETLAYTEQFFIIIWVLSAMIFFYQHTKEILANKSKGFLSAPASDFFSDWNSRFSDGTGQSRPWVIPSKVSF